MSTIELVDPELRDALAQLLPPLTAESLTRRRANALELAAALSKPSLPDIATDEIHVEPTVAAARNHCTARGREGHSHPAGKPYPVEANPWSGMKWQSAFLVSSRHRKWRMRQGLPAISEAPFSPIMIVGACVQALRAAGMIEASTTRRPSMPLTRSCGSTTAVGSVPMRQVPLGWK
jgi:hypothetical protein